MKRTFGNDLEGPAGTREKVISLLLEGPRTVSELAKSTSITNNAVRAQIALLQRDGIVQVEGTAKTARRPAARYALRRGSEVHLSKAYPAVLSALVRSLAEDLPDDKFRDLMQRLGRQLASSAPRPSGTPEERIQNVLAVLKSMGSPAQVMTEGKDIVITSPACLISEAVSADARVCGAMEAFAHELTGLPVQECCQRGERPACRFKIELPKDQ